MDVWYVAAILVLLSAVIVGLQIRAKAADRESRWVYSVAGISVLLAAGVMVFAAIALIWVFTIPS